MGAPWRFKKVVPPGDRFWADPHVIRRDGRYYVFIEENPNDTHGHIAVMEIREDGSCTTPTPVLKEPFHLSYPFLFEWEGELYMIPESGGHRQVRVYRCDEFSDRWSLDHVLLENTHAVDATLFEHGGRWWMFTTIAEHPGMSTHDELFLFSASSPLATEWTPHPMNPIVSDVTRARPAGPVFKHEGRVIRPAQDCAKSYGHSLRLMEVVELTAERYGEREVGCLSPDWEHDLEGTHSFARAGRLNVIDVKVRRARWRYILLVAVGGTYPTLSEATNGGPVVGLGLLDMNRPGFLRELVN